jgi:DNA-binding transcriptional LysR family regulator
MELRHLRYFVLVAEELHFGRAAERAGIAQPPLSQQVRSLESELGVELFHRTNRRVSLTDAGRALLPDARRLLRDADRAAHSARAADQGMLGTVRIGLVGSAAFGWLPGAVVRVRRELPAIRVNLREMTSEQQRLALAADQIDIGLVRYPLFDDTIWSEQITSERLLAVVPDHWSLPEAAEWVSPDVLADLPLIIFPRELGPPLYDQIMRLFGDAGVSPRLEQEAVQMSTILGLVSAGMGVAIVPESITALRVDGIRFLPVRGADGSSPTTGIYLVQRKHERSSVVERFVEQLRRQSAI